jgi:CheY-like chemotaxis protein
MSLEKRTILIVDDDPDFLTQLELSLEACGCNVVKAGSRKEAEELLKTFRPDAAILDLMMDDFDDGFILAHHIKAKDATVPVIMATAVAAETGLQFDTVGDPQHRWVKADAVLTKPLRFEQLKKELDRLLG